MTGDPDDEPEPLKPLACSVPLGAGESPSSFASRLAAANRVLVSDLCLDFRQSFQRVTFGDRTAVEAIAALGGVDPAPLLENTITKEANSYLFRRERLVRRDLRRDRIRYCPACLLDDIADADRPAHLAPYGRAIWMLGPVRTCHIHGFGLLEAAIPMDPRLPGDFARAIQPLIPSLEHLRDTAVRRPASDLEAYLLARLDGARASPWLDSLDFHAAAKFTEMLGALVLFGRRDGLDNLSEEDRQRAGQVGFEFANGGEPAIRSLLDSLLVGFKFGAGGGGPQAVYGRCFWDWLSRGAPHPAYDPVRDIVRTHAVENIPLAAGEIVLGKPLAERRWHTVHSAAVEAGIHPKRLRKLFVAAELIPADASDADVDGARVSADGAAAVIAAVTDSVTLKDLRTYANIPRVHARKLVENGFIQPFLESRSAGAQEHFTRADVDEFIARLLDGAEPVDTLPPGAADLPAAVKRACCTIVDVLRLVLDRRLKWTGRLSTGRGYLALLVDVDEVRSYVRGPEHGGFTLRQVEKALQTSTRVVTALIEIGVLPVRSAVNAVNRCPVVVVDPDDLAAFQHTFVSLTVLARERGRHFRTVLAEIEGAGVKPAFDPEIVKARFYRRKEVGCHARFVSHVNNVIRCDDPLSTA